MSYADIAARGPKQTPEEAAAPPVPEINHDSSTTSSLIDVDSPHVVSVPSDFEEQKVKTETQATRLEHEAEDKERTARKKAADMAEKAKKEASADAKKAKKEAKKAMGKLSDNRENPVVVGNAILWGITAIALGVCVPFLWNSSVLANAMLTHSTTVRRVQGEFGRQAGLEGRWYRGWRGGRFGCG